ncbi:hypothetical protein SAMN05880593_101127 [Rhizobium sp. RU36D]|nr:hypothetical protein SAMN05880593_101127 [Rhizobium sp. RU36D]
MKTRAFQRPLLIALGFGVLVGVIVASMVTMIVMRNGTHAAYCPASSAVWIIPCVPTATSILMFGWVVLLFSLPISMILFLIFRIKR